MVARSPERSARPTQRPLIVVLWCALLVLIAQGATGCQKFEGSELLAVTSVEPRQVHFGSPWSLVGDGFALGSQPLVRLQGTVYRAGHAPRAFDLSVRATTLSQERLRVQLPAAAQNGACGPPDDASHATFRGEIQVAIAAHAPGAPPVTGTLRAAELEFYPASQTRRAELKAAEHGQRAMSFAGFELVADIDGGLSVVSAVAGGRADRAGLAVGDRIVRAGGVTVLQPSDLGSRPARSLRLLVYRGATPSVVHLDVDGLVARPPARLNWAAIPVGAVALLLLLSALAPRSLLSWFDPIHTERWGRGRFPFSSKRRTALAKFLAWLSGAVVLVCESQGRSLGPVEQAALLLPPMMLAAAALICATALVRSGRVSARRWSLVLGGRAVVARWVCVAPAAIVLVTLLIESGLDFERSVLSQKAAPLEWRALSGPGEFLLLGLFLLPTLSLSAPSNRRSSAANEGCSGLSDWYLCSTAATATLVFLGGGQLPPSFSALPALSVGLLLFKYALLVLILRSVRQLALGISLRVWWRGGLGLALPVSLASVATTVLWVDEIQSIWLLQWLRGGFGECCAAALCLGAVGVGAHWIRCRRTALLSGTLSPWL